MLLETEVGEGIFFAGQKHVAIKIVASDAEHELITTAPEEIARRQAREKAGGELKIAKSRVETVAEEELAGKSTETPPQQDISASETEPPTPL